MKKLDVGFSGLTNYNKSHIQDIKDKTENKIPCFNAVIKPEIKQIELQSMYHNRVDFNTLTPENKWQKFMLSVLDENKDLILKEIDTTITAIDNKIVVDTTINSFDNFMVQLKTKANETNFHFSKNDIEKLYNLLCFEELQKQDVESAKYNPSRSWSALKKSLNVWFSKRLNLNKEKFYTIIVNDMLKSDNKSILKKMIHKALVGFREIFEIETESKDGKKNIIVVVPPKELSFTDDYEQIECNKNVYNFFYNAKKYLGKENEEKFITFIEEENNVEWWHKQGDSGKDVFAVEYYDSTENKDRLFFPDFIVKTKDKLYTLDTKKDATAKSTETKDKSEALQKWIKENQDIYDFELIGGIAIYEYPYWKFNNQDIYIYKNDSEWLNLVF